ncbi:MAG: MobC family plasmid mobilization relaxosome protein [Oscillospiraceae bacterium]|nr:MobC family plasmid mobilization relaxosome protein [Oscillospiraceae bacterium]
MGRLRNNIISLWLSDRELEHLEMQAFLAGRRVSPFIRDVIAGAKLKEHPPKEWAELVRQLSGMCNNVNQIAKVANVAGTVDTSAIDAISSMQSQIWQKIKGL